MVWSQSPSRDTIAIGDQGELLRSDDRNPMLRPGGDGWRVIRQSGRVARRFDFVKNIDNVGQEHLEGISAACIKSWAAHPVQVRGRG